MGAPLVHPQAARAQLAADRREHGALVATALETAHAEGARHALIEADDDGDAKRLYERLGFRTVWVRHSFTRKPA